MQDTSTMSEAADVGVGLSMHDPLRWKAKWEVHKFNNADLEALGISPEAPAWFDIEKAMADGRLVPYETIEREGNLLMYGGVSCLWECLIGNGTGTAGQTLTFFNNANAAIGVGDSTTAAAATQTNLVAATNKLRKAMEATYPTHTDGVVAGAADIVFRSVFATGDANFAWQEWGVFNSATDAVGRMLNRKVESLGTKTSAATWTFTVTLSIA